MSKESLDQIGEIKDTIDNLIHATDLAMPAEFHLNCLKDELKQIEQTLKEIYVKESGENPWE